MSFFTLSSHFALSLFLTILVFFKNLISGVDDPALNPADCTDRGWEDDEDDGEGEEGEEEELHGERDAREERGLGLGLRILRQVWWGELKLERMQATRISDECDKGRTGGINFHAKPDKFRYLEMTKEPKS